MKEADEKPFSIAVLGYPARSRFVASTSVATEAARRGHRVQIFGMEESESWLSRDAQKMENVEYVWGPGDLSQAEAEAEAVVQFRDDYEYLKYINGTYHFAQSLKALDLAFAEKFCGASGADIVLLDVRSTAAAEACEKAGTPVAVISEQVEQNVMAAKDLLTPSADAFAMFGNKFNGEALRTLTLDGFVARAKNLALLAGREWVISAFPELGGSLAVGRALQLVTTSPELDGPKEVGPNVKYVGPFVDDRNQREDKELEEWLDSFAGQDPERPGVIFVSVGSILEEDQDVRQVASAVRRLSEGNENWGVLWALPPNHLEVIERDVETAAALNVAPGMMNTHGSAHRVRVKVQVPHHRVLSKPGVKMYVTNARHETYHKGLYFGKPLALVSSDGDVDHERNVASAVDAGVAAGAKKLTSDSIVFAVHKVMSTPAMGRKAKAIGRTLQRGGGAPRAVDELETVVRLYDGDISRLAPNRLKAHWFVHWHLDFLALFVLLATAQFCILQCFCRCCCGSSKPVEAEPAKGKKKAKGAKSE